MNATLIKNSPASPIAFVARIGFDWGDKEHAFCLLADGSAKMESGTFPHSAEALHRWFQQLGERFQGRPVALALESTCGPLLHVLTQYAWLRIFPVNPVTSARFRTAFVPSGAKDDLPDAGVLLNLLCQHQDKIRPMEWEDENTRRLAGLVQARRDTVDRRTQTLNQLTVLLKTCYPQALELAGAELCAPLALEFLRRWPDLLSLKAARPSTVRAFYYRLNVRRPELVEKRVARIKESVCLTTDPAIMSVYRLQLRLLLDLTGSYNKHIGQLQAAIDQTFAQHADAALFKELPGAGPVLAPRLAAAFGSDRTRYPDAASFQKYAGLAPVREKSGGQLWTHWRWQAPVFLRQSLIEWAGQTVVWSLWAKRYYQRMRVKGKKHHVILRALAFKWARVLWKCWITRTPYNESKYMETLRRKGSPNAIALV
jgi:transposase